MVGNYEDTKKKFRDNFLLFKSLVHMSSYDEIN